MNNLYRYLFGMVLLTLATQVVAEADSTANPENSQQSVITRLLPDSATVSLPWQQSLQGLNLASVSAERQLLAITGINPNHASVLIVIRIDDQQSHDYFSRMNLERTVAPGAFALQLDLAGLKTPAGRYIDLDALTDLRVFSAVDTDTKIQLTQVQIRAAKPLVGVLNPSLVVDFGTSDSPVLPGVMALTPAQPLSNRIRLQGLLRGVNRPGPEPWLQDGIAGIDTLSIPVTSAMLAAGRFWQLTLFREDVGEWENLPRQHNLDVEINGIHYDGQLSSEPRAKNWYQQQYLSLYEQAAAYSPWQDIVQKRGLRQQFPLDISGRSSIEIRFLGETPSERYVAGLVLQPIESSLTGVNDGNLLTAVERQRQEYFQQHWHVKKTLPASLQQAALANPERVASNQPFVVRYFIDSEAGLKEAELKNVQLQADIPGFRSEFRVAQASWYREGSQLQLIKDIRHLKSPESEYAAGQYLLHAFFYPDNSVSADGLASDRAATKHRIRFVHQPDSEAGQVEIIAEHTLQRLPMTLDYSGKSVGIYLDDNPALNWFDEFRPYRLAQTYCDLRFLQKTGLKALAPPLVTPTADNLPFWQQQLTLYQRFYPQQDLLAYTPYKRLKAILNTEGLQRQLSRIQNQPFTHSHLYWSIADEAQPEQYNEIHQDAERLHSANQVARPTSENVLSTMKTALQLNHDEQIGLAESGDLLLINHGFGVSRDAIQQLAKKQKVWLYNMPQYRHAAGLMLWRSDAQAYVQWHGRMPTANPYDPTDGREADYQFFPPQPTPCSALPDVDRRLFDLLRGYNDLAWFQWLEQQDSPAAKALLRDIHQHAGEDWQDIASVSSLQLIRWRKAMTRLALSL